MNFPISDNKINEAGEVFFVHSFCTIGLITAKNTVPINEMYINCFGELVDNKTGTVIKRVHNNRKAILFMIYTSSFFIWPSISFKIVMDVFLSVKFMFYYHIIFFMVNKRNM